MSEPVTGVCWQHVMYSVYVTYYGIQSSSRSRQVQLDGEREPNLSMWLRHAGEHECLNRLFYSIAGPGQISRTPTPSFFPTIILKMSCKPTTNLAPILRNRLYTFGSRALSVKHRDRCAYKTSRASRTIRVHG